MASTRIFKLFAVVWTICSGMQIGKLTRFYFIVYAYQAQSSGDIFESLALWGTYLTNVKGCFRLQSSICHAKSRWKDKRVVSKGRKGSRKIKTFVNYMFGGGPASARIGTRQNEERK